ncbi:integrase core domain-containing protein [Blastopirellula retiformator]|uniref:Site-specific tyrosine recombinase XerC n=1 Tax=Blastopirellula retiformator TaxID=2527970 RepID=A0A5C5VLM4_9BACT|nr:integrase core domain-containing protein [Blastopirellula retiformator]TWT39524.1 site-specific tyrosine recombinase XerC [Blastopirellula retiformator]
MLNWSVEQEYLPRNPIAGMKKPRRKRRDVFYTAQQWKQIRENTSGPLVELLDFLYLTGCRPLEARSIEARQLHGDLVIFPADESKGKHEPRVIYLVPDAKAILDRLAKDRPAGALFRNQRGRPWTKDSIKCKLTRVSKAVGFRVIAYGARHSFATEALTKGGVDPISVAHRLVKFGAKLGKAVHEIVTIVGPSTILRWIRESKKPGGVKQVRKGRPRTKEEIRELIIRFARENDWGYTRIMGELKKLGIKPPSRNTVKNILKENGLEPGPKRGEGTWDEFLKMHAATLWQCDFYAKRVLTLKGWRDLYLLIFLHVESRQVYIAPSTFHPNEEWAMQQAEAFLEHVKSVDLPIETLMHDRDKKFTAKVDDAFQAADIRVVKSAYRSPNTNAFVERFIQTLQRECLDHFVVFGEQHMDYLVKEFVGFYHAERPHQGKDNSPLEGRTSRNPMSCRSVRSPVVNDLAEC